MFISWKTGASGNYLDAGNWSPNSVPAYANSAQIAVAGNYTVTIDAISTGFLTQTVDQLVIKNPTATFEIDQRASFVAVTTVNNAGVIMLDNGSYDRAQLTADDLINSGSLIVDGYDGSGGAHVLVDDALTSTGSITVGNADLEEATTVQAGRLITLGDVSATGSAANKATINFGVSAAPLTLNSKLAASTNAEIIFSTGTIQTISATGSLSLNGKFGLVETSGGAETAFALTSNAGSMALDNDVSMTLAGGFVNQGELTLDGAVYASLGGTLKVTGDLTNSGVLGVATGYAGGGAQFEVTGDFQNTNQFYLGQIGANAQSSAVTLGQLDSSGTFRIGGGDAANTVTVMGAANFTAGYADIYSGATLSAAAISVTGTGELRLDGGAVAAPITVASGGVLAISTGVFTGSVNLESGGAEIVDDSVTVDAPTPQGGEIDFGANDTLSSHIVFGAGHDALIMKGAATGLEIDGFGAKSKLDLGDLQFNGGQPVLLNTATQHNVLEVAGANRTADIQLDPDANYTGVQFAGIADASGGTVVSEVTCYVAGTRIRTDKGEVAVERLAIGDLVATTSGEKRPVRWLGHRTVDASTHKRPHEVMPIRISAQAFAPNRPSRVLFVSPGHAICVDVEGEVLIPACALVNGSTIQQIEAKAVTYWHVELDSHDVLLAENLACESYLDMGNRGFFVEADAVALDGSPDAPRRTHAHFCRPFHSEGPVVERARAMLRLRAECLGFRLTTEADAHLVAAGERIDPIWMSDTRLAFVLPAGREQITLCSNVFVPAYTVAGSSDQRKLGMCVGRLQIDGSLFELDDDDKCASGWREAEFSDGRLLHRWTNGATPLPTGARVVIIDLSGVGHYWRTHKEDVASRFA